MDVEKAKLIRILHYIIDEFISAVKNSFLSEVVDIQRVFCEIVKRKESIIQELQNIAFFMHNKTCLESKELYFHDIIKFPEWEKSFRIKIESLIEKLFSQDLLEIALNGNESFSITDEDLHNLLYSDTLKDITSFAPSLIEMRRQFNFSTPFFTFAPCIEEETPKSPFVNCTELFSEFESTSLQFNAEISQMRKVAEKGFSVSECNITSLSNSEDCKAAAKMIELTKGKHMNWFEESKDSFPNCSFTSSSSVDFDLEALFNDAEDFPVSNILSWENCLGPQFLREHTYISEATPEAAHLNISEKEYHTYSSLISISDAISEDEMILDILDVLTGTPSNTFFYDIHSRKFKMKSGVHLTNLSAECTIKVVAKFVVSGSMYYALQNFSRDFLHASEGSVFRGMQCGIQQVLCMYKEYIEAVKVNFPTMLFLKTDVVKNAELLLNFGIICGIDPEKMIISEIPKGLGLLSYLHDVARSHKGKESGIMIAILLKYAYAPYFSFLNEWMSEGHCNDPQNEFQIIEDPNFLKRCDSLFWKFAYTENIDDPTRAVPPELKDFSQGILDCGKSIKLLKHLNSDLYNLKKISYKPPPPLSMTCSFPAVINKVKECLNYVILKDYMDSIPDFKNCDLWDYKVCVEAQSSVNDKEMWKLLKRRYNIIAASNASKSNILDFKKICCYSSKYAEVESSESQCRCDCLPVSVVENEVVVSENTLANVGLIFSSAVEKCTHGYNFQIPSLSLSKNWDDNFSGKLYDSIGLLFSSCGYVEKETSSENLFVEAEWDFLSSSFSKQICLSSYNHCSYTSIDANCSKFSSPEIIYWNFPNHANKILKTLKSTGLSISANEESFIKDVLLNSITSNILSDEKRKFSICNDKNKNTFMDKITSLLISEYGDSIEDIYSYIQVTSLQRLMVHNFQSVLKTRILVVEKAIMKCIVKEYHLDSLLSNLQNIYFLQDEAFSHSLCKPLFQRVMKCRTPGEFAKYSDLNGILVNAISSSDCGCNPLAFSLNMSTGFPLLDPSIERIDFLQLFIIECMVNWPLNIIVHHTCIQQYLKIFSTLLEIEFLCWLLGQTWEHLIMTSKVLHIQDKPEFRKMMLNRFEMDQFVRVIRNSIHQHLQGPLWVVLNKSLSAEQSGIDDLETAHNEYLEKVLARCFLTDETYKLHDLLSSMFHQVYRICSAILECVWKKNHKNGHYEISSRFKNVTKDFELFTQYQNVFLQYIMKQSLTKKCGRYWDKDYQSFLETIIETKNIH